MLKFRVKLVVVDAGNGVDVVLYNCIIRVYIDADDFKNVCAWIIGNSLVKIMNIRNDRYWRYGIFWYRIMKVSNWSALFNIFYKLLFYYFFYYFLKHVFKTYFRNIVIFTWWNRNSIIF